MSQPPPAVPAVPAVSYSTLIVVMGIVTIVGIIGLNIYQPAIDHTTLDVQIVTMSGVIIAFLKTQQVADAQKGLHSLVNSRLTELVESVRASSLAIGREQGAKESNDAALLLAAQVAANQAAANLTLANTAKDLAARAADVLAAAKDK